MRISVQLLLFFVFMNAFAGALTATPIAGDLGINPDPGGDEKLEQADAEAEEFASSNSGGDTLFGLYNALAGVLEGLINTLPAIGMMKNAGAPAWLVNYGFAGYSIIIGLDVAGYLRTGGLMQ